MSATRASRSRGARRGPWRLCGECKRPVDPALNPDRTFWHQACWERLRAEMDAELERRAGEGDADAGHGD